MMRLVRYTPDRRAEWDSAVRRSKNATFLFCRDYMEYHADRFTDCSLMVLDEDDDDAVVSVLPASLHGTELRSHGGLTYGGWVCDDRTSAAGPRSPMAWFDLLQDFCRSAGITDVVYKPVPHIYHRHPAEEDLYALFRLDAALQVRNLASVIDLEHPIPSSRLGKRALKRQRLGGITVAPTDSAADFWQIIVDDRRERHNVTPVHTCAEIQTLHDRFPDEIRFFTASAGGRIVAGAVIYVANGVLHLQYAAADATGKEIYAVDVIYHELLFNLMPGARYFDFGSNNEDAGRYLNAGMVRHKEEFGARSIIYDAYRLHILG